MSHPLALLAALALAALALALAPALALMAPEPARRLWPHWAAATTPRASLIKNKLEGNTGVAPQVHGSSFYVCQTKI